MSRSIRIEFPNAERAPRGDALGAAPEARVRHRRRDLRWLRRHDAHHRAQRRSGGDQGDPRAPGGQSAPGARTAAATRPGAACGGLKAFTQRHRINRVYPDAVGSMTGQGIGGTDGCARRERGGNEARSMR